MLERGGQSLVSFGALKGRCWVAGAKCSVPGKSLRIYRRSKSRLSREFATMNHRASHIVAAFMLLTAANLEAAEHYDVQIERGVTVKMRDGVTLRADIYRPKATGRFPVLL